MSLPAVNREVLGLIPWLVGSWLLSGGAMLLLWFARGWGRPAGAARRFLEAPGWLVSPGEALAILYALGGPYAALVTGFLDPAAMGLAGISWWPSLGRGILFGAGLLALTGLAWLVYLRIGMPPAGLLARSQRLAAAPAGRPLLLLWAAAEETHWAFYRTVPLLLWGPLPGLWIGLLLVVAEHGLQPQTTARLRQPGGVEEEAWWLARLVAMTAAFALLRNLWLCIVLHALLEGLAAALLLRRAGGPVPIPVQEDGGPARASVPVAISAAAVALLLLALFTGCAAWPALVSPVPAATTASPTALAVPTATTLPTRRATASTAPLPTRPGTQAPTATAPLAASLTPALPRTYVVRPGDTLKSIAAALGVSLANLMRVNDITNPDALQVGHVLIIP